MGADRGHEVKEFDGKVVVITGASSGIGRETALAFARRGVRLSLCDIDVKGLEEVGREAAACGCAEVRVEEADVSKADQVERFCDNTYRDMGRVDVLVNNAGVSVGGKFEDMSLEDWEWIVGTNLWGVVYGCHFFYPRMARDGGGHIVNIASAAGLMPLSVMSAYCCTKHAVLGFSRTLRPEAAAHNIGVSTICPGFIRTNIVLSTRYCSEPRHMSPERLLKLVDRFFRIRNYKPRKVAAAVLKAVERNRSVVPVSPEAYMGDALNRLNRRIWDAINTVNVKVYDRFL